MSSLGDYDDTKRVLVESVCGWAQSNLAPSVKDRDASGEFDRALYERLGCELGIFGVTLPESLNGAGLDVSATIAVIEALSMTDPGMAMSYLSHELLFSHQLYWTWQAIGEEVPARHADILKRHVLGGMAMTEPNAGTDVLGMRTTAVETEDGYRLDGVKQWITNGPDGDAFLVYARTGEDRRAISLFLVTSDCAGFDRTPCDEKMGMRTSSTGVLVFQDCHIPKDSLVGRLNDGLRPMLRNLTVERLGLAAQSCGIAQSCFDVMRAYSTQRIAFGKQIVEFGQIQKMLSESYATCRAMHAILYEGVREILSGRREASVTADAVKLFCSSAGERVSRDAVQMLGANGYSSAYPVERLHRDSILLSIGGGTNEALQKNISRLLTRSA